MRPRGRLAGATRGPFVVAHRGASEVAPENTMPAFEQALRDGCEVLECDVQLSRDDQVVVIHDAFLQRTTSGSGRVREWRWADLRRLDAGYPGKFGERYRGTALARLDDVLDLTRGRAELMIEIKSESVGPRAGGIEELCLRAARRVRSDTEIAVISMHPVAVARVVALAPWVPTGQVFRRHQRRRLVRDTERVGAQLLIVPTGTLMRQPAVVTRARAAGLRVGAYVVNEPGTLVALARSGVESLASDRPARMRAALEDDYAEPAETCR